MSSESEFESGSSSSEDEFQTQTLDRRAQRTTYLVTYSQIDFKKFPTRRSFALAVVQEFEASGKVGVTQWACCKENHRRKGKHYHLSLKLSAKKRWLSVKNSLIDSYGIVVNFSAKHDNYYSAYKYVTKKDKRYLLSTGHPDLTEIGPPRTAHCVQARREKRKAQDEGEGSAGQQPPSRPVSTKKHRLENLDVAILICDRGFTSPTQLRALAEEQRKEGKRDLAQFCINRTTARLDDIFHAAWKMRNAKSDLTKSNRNRLDVIRQFADKECAPSCAGKWLEMAFEILQKNDIHPIVFAHALRQSVNKGRGKERNIMLVGPTNSGKTFLLDPLTHIFDCFTNPANNKYAWVGVDEKECIVLQDFSLSSFPDLISWKSLLLLLEGQKVHLPAPKNHYAKDVELKRDIPVLATSGERIVYYNRFNVVDQRETAMMDSRWKYIEFTYQFPVEEQIEIDPCPKCFAELVLHGIRDL